MSYGEEDEHQVGRGWAKNRGLRAHARGGIWLQGRKGGQAHRLLKLWAGVGGMRTRKGHGTTSLT